MAIGIDIRPAQEGLAQIQRAISLLDKTSTSARQVEQHLRKSESAFIQFTSSVSKSNTALTDLQNRVKTLESEVKRLNTELHKTSNHTEKNTRSLNRGTGAFTAFGSAVRGVTGALGKLWFAYGQLAPLIAGFSFVRLTQEAIKASQELQYSLTYMLSVGTAADKATYSVEGLSKELLNLKDANGNVVQLAHSADQLAEGMLEFIRAGIGVAEAKENLVEMSRFATVAGLSMSEAVRSVIGMVNAFRSAQKVSSDKEDEVIAKLKEQGIERKKAIKSTLDYRDAANMVAYAAERTATNIPEMTKAFSQLAEAGIVSRLRLDEVAAMMGVLANAGIRGSMGAVSLRGAVIKLQNPMDKVHKLLRSVGKEFSAFNADGSAKNAVELFTDLNEILEDVTEKKRTEIFYNLFGLRQMKAGAVFSDFVKDIASMSEEIRKAAEGTTFLERVFEDLKKTAKMAWEFIKAEFRNTLIEQVDMTKWTDFLWDIHAAIRTIRPYVGDFVKVLWELVEVFGPAYLAKYTLIFISHLATLATTTLPAAVGQLYAFATANFAAATAVQRLQTAFWAVALFIGSWKLGEYLRKHYVEVDNFGAWVAGVGMKIVEAFKLVFNSVVTFFTGVWDIFKRTIEASIGWFMNKFKIGEMIETIFNKIGNILLFSPKLSSFIGMTEEDARSIAAFGAQFKTLNNGFSEGQEPVDALTSSFKKFSSALSDNFENYYKNSDAIDYVTVSQMQFNNEAHRAGTVADSSSVLMKKYGDSVSDSGEDAAGAGDHMGTLAERLDSVRAAFEGLGVVQGRRSNLAKAFDQIKDKAQSMAYTVNEAIKTPEGKKAMSEMLKEYGYTIEDFSKDKLPALTKRMQEAFAAETMEKFGDASEHAFERAEAGISKYQKALNRIDAEYEKQVKRARTELGGTAYYDAAVAKARAVRDQQAAEVRSQLAADQKAFEDNIDAAFEKSESGLSQYERTINKIGTTLANEIKKAKELYTGNELDAMVGKLKAVHDELVGIEKAKALKEQDEFIKSIATEFGRAESGLSKYEKAMQKLDKLREKMYDDAEKHALSKSDEEYFERARKEIEQWYTWAKENSKEVALAGQDIGKGFAWGVHDAVDELKTLGEVGYDIAKDLKDAFHDTFVKVLKGDFEDIGDLWKSLLDKMLDLLIDWVASALAKFAMLKIKDIFGGSGGIFGGLFEALGLSDSKTGGDGTGLLGGLSNLFGLVSGFKWLAGTTVGKSLGLPALGEAIGSLSETIVSAASSILGLNTAAEVTTTSFGVLASQAGPALLPVAPALQTPGAGAGAGAGASFFQPWMAPAAVFAIGAGLFISQMMKKQAPEAQDYWNKWGIRPADFAHLIGAEFQKTLVPYYGERDAKWDTMANALIILKDAERYKQQKEQAASWGEVAPTGGIGAMTWAGDTWAKGSQELTKLWLAMESGRNVMDGSITTFEEFMEAAREMGVALETSTLEGLWEWQEASMSSTEKIRRSLTELGVGGAELQKSMELLDIAMQSAHGSTAELERYLLSLGYTQEQVAKAIADFSSTWTEHQNAHQNALIALVPGLQATINALNEETEAELGLTRAATGAARSISGMDDLFGGLNSEIGDLPRALDDASRSVREFARSINEIPGHTPPPAEGNASGGLLRGGSGTKDDLFLGYINGRAQLAMGGEYIVNPKATRRHLSLLERINADRYRAGGQPPSLPPGPPPPFPQPNPVDTIRTATGDNLKKLIEMMNDVLWDIASFGRTDFQNQIAEIRKKFQEMYNEAKALGASEEDLIDIRQLEALQINRLREERRKAQQDFMQDINDQISAFGMTDTEIAIRDSQRAMEESLAAARELGLGEAALAKIRQLHQLQVEEILEEQRKAQREFMLGIEDQIAMFGMTDMEKSLFENQRAMEAAIKAAEDLGLGESDLAKIRELYGLKAAEIMTAGLREALSAITSFKDSMAGITDEATRSAQAQDELFKILGQARRGDFSGVEAIGDVLKNISINKSSYATAAEYAEAYWRTMAAVNEIEQLTNLQLNGGTIPNTTNAVLGATAVTAGAAVNNASTSGASTTANTTATSETAAVITELKNLRESMVAGNVQVAKNTNKSLKILQRWDAVGLPATAP